MSGTVGQRLSQVGAALGIVSFAITYFTTEQVNVALGVTGLVYIYLGFTVGVYVLILKEDRPTYLKAFAAAASLAALGLITWNYADDPPALEHFGLPQIWGALALAGLALSVFVLIQAGRTPTKTCPDCAETVKDAALVCKHCGYRWGVPSKA